MTSSIESFLASNGLWAVFVLMAIDAVFPAASEVVMLYGGALASGALTHQLDVLGTPRSGFGAYLAIAIAGTLGYLRRRDRRAGRSGSTAGGRSSSGAGAGST